MPSTPPALIVRFKALVFAIPAVVAVILGIAFIRGTHIPPAPTSPRPSPTPAPTEAPDMSVNPEPITPAIPPRIAYRIDVRERMEIFRDHHLALLQSIRDADRRFDLTRAENSELQASLVAEYDRQVCERHGITPGELTLIYFEGVEKRWPKSVNPGGDTSSTSGPAR